MQLTVRVMRGKTGAGLWSAQAMIRVANRIYVYIYIYIYTYIHIYIYTYTHIHTHTYIHIRIYRCWSYTKRAIGARVP